MRDDWSLTFSFEALLSEDADEGEELCDLLQIENCGIVQLDDGQRLLVVSAAAAILQEPVGRETDAFRENSIGPGKAPSHPYMQETSMTTSIISQHSS